MKTNTQIYERVAAIEAHQQDITKQLDAIMNNHLAHLQEDVQKLTIQVNTLTIKLTVFVAIAVFIVEVATRLLIK